MQHPPLRRQPWRQALATLGALLACGGVQAQSSPYYIGVAQSLAYDNNLYRVDSGRGLPLGAKSKSDTSATTSLVAGVDQTWGRQRLSGSGSLRSSRFADNDQLNNNGYGLNLGLDWETVDRISGRLALKVDRSLRSFDPAYQGSQGAEKNIEDNNQITGTVRIGVVTRLTAEATVSRRQVRFSSPAYSSSEYDQTTGSLGGRYRLGGSTTVGLAWRQSDVNYPTGTGDYKRRDIDLSTNWDPGGQSSVYARISHTATDHKLHSNSDFSGMTAELRGTSQVTGKIKLVARLSRDLGQGLSTVDFLGQTDAAEFNRIGTAMHLSADYALSAKLSATANLAHVRRSFDGTQSTLTGKDSTSTVGLGARWLPTRNSQLGCDISHETRSVQNTGLLQVGRGYTSSGISCYGQIVLQ